MGVRTVRQHGHCQSARASVSECTERVCANLLNRYHCNVCETGAFVEPVQQAKANRTFFQEVQALHYWPRFRLGEDTPEGPKVSTIFEPNLAVLFKTNKNYAQVSLPKRFHALLTFGL